MKPEVVHGEKKDIQPRVQEFKLQAVKLVTERGVTEVMGAGAQDPALLRTHERPHPVYVGQPPRVREQAGSAGGALIVRDVAPPRDHLVQHPGFAHEVAERVRQVLLVERPTPGLVQLQEGREPAGVEGVGALLDEHQVRNL